MFSHSWTTVRWLQGEGVVGGGRGIGRKNDDRKSQIKLKIKIKKCSFIVVLGHTAKSISMEQNNRKLYSSIIT